MTQTPVYQLRYDEARTYLLSTLFVAGNILLPQLCHLVPQGGLILLPIYFFTLIAAYKFGITAGLMTAIASPLVNHLLFGMPPMAVLPILLIKSSLLAIFASMIARRLGRVTFMGVVLVVIGYQLVGAMVEWPMTGSFMSAMQDFRLGLPGILIQIVIGHYILSRI